MIESVETSGEIDEIESTWADARREGKRIEQELGLAEFKNRGV